MFYDQGVIKDEDKPTFTFIINLSFMIIKWLIKFMGDSAIEKLKEIRNFAEKYGARKQKN